MKLLILWLAMHSKVESAHHARNTWNTVSGAGTLETVCVTDSEKVRECFYFEFPVKGLKLRVTN